jgi:hypothetical protein
LDQMLFIATSIFSWHTLIVALIFHWLASMAVFSLLGQYLWCPPSVPGQFIWQSSFWPSSLLGWHLWRP